MLLPAHSAGESLEGEANIGGGPRPRALAVCRRNGVVPMGTGQQTNVPGGGQRWRLPHWRFFTWVILLFNLVMLIWLVSGVASTARDCDGLVGNALTDCEASNVGTGIGATLIVVLWAMGDVILGVLWLVTDRRGRRDCPVCGNGVRRGVLVCGSCGYDFRAAAAQPQAGGERPRPGPGIG
ncbi:hypothetical protein [Kitasatospora sp. KL5]|uniref:hypothetical protein n=1 Tax=Kitasatospora sp. KL5 TaxID=3425125 RepID=UPI003D701B24